MNNLFRRTFTGAWIVIFVLGGFWLHPISFFLTGLIILAGTQYEYFLIVRNSGVKPQVIPGMIAGATAYIISTLIASGVLLDPYSLTIGFARRFATYKRATLLLRDKERLELMVNDPLRPVQFIFAGKAHPQDEAGKAMIWLCSKEAWIVKVLSAKARRRMLPIMSYTDLMSCFKDERE